MVNSLNLFLKKIVMKTISFKSIFVSKSRTKPASIFKENPLKIQIYKILFFERLFLSEDLSHK